MGGMVLQDKEGNFVMPGEVRYDANDSAPIYIGLAANNKTPTDALAWTVYKLTYSVSNVTRIQKASNIAWDDRTTASHWT